MIKLFFVTLTLSTLLQSCGQQNKSVESNNYKNTIKLGKFYDNVNNSTFDESKLTDLPRSINLIKDMSSVKNQSDRDSCTFFSTAAMLEATIKKDMGIEVNLSEEYINYSAKSAGSFPNDEGSSVLNNLSAVKASGLMLERDSAYQPTWFGPGLPCEKYKATDAKTPAICFSHNAPDVVMKKKGIEKDTNDIIRLLAEEKRPITMSVVVNFNGWPDNGDTFYNENLRKECIADPDKCGAHSVLLTGYDLDKKVFFFKNSWGAKWGHAGYGTMPIDTLDRYAQDDFYFAKLKANLNIPKDYAIDLIKLKSFSYQTVEGTKNKLSLYVSAEVANASGHLIYISSFLTKKNKGITEKADDQNTYLMELTPEEAKVTGDTVIRAVSYITNPNDTLVLTKSAPAVLNFLPEVENSLSAALNSEDTLLKTTIYVHTDDNSYKVLKRIYGPIVK
jgi:C1A family cysteine protease